MDNFSMPCFLYQYEIFFLQRTNKLQGLFYIAGECQYLGLPSSPQTYDYNQIPRQLHLSFLTHSNAAAYSFDTSDSVR